MFLEIFCVFLILVIRSLHTLRRLLQHDEVAHIPE
jgi:hypothetical protein